MNCFFFSLGKTYFLVELLKRAQTNIQPAPQRIIWLYKRWQPLYDVIKATVVPRVEFIKGVPLNLDRDDFIDPRVRNMIVLDDMAMEASKDQRVTDLFTEGSHHRNLSVIALNQNLYLSKDPTQRRNCHYLVLFNNPVDKQPIATLARQMYPNKSRELLRHYDEAISRPYGYLLVDLKPTTPETKRMRTNVLGIKGIYSDNLIHLSDNIRAVQTGLTVSEGNTSGNQKVDIFNQTEKNSDYQRHDTMASCDDCGVMFENVHDLQNHVKKWCPEQNDLKLNKSYEEIMPSKRMRYSEADKDESDGSIVTTDQEREVYSDIADRIKTLNEAKWQQKVDKYENEGMNSAEAEERADMKLRQDDMRAFMERYGIIISYIMKLSVGYIHTQIMNTIQILRERDMSEERAIRIALRKYSHYFDEYLDNEEENRDVNDRDENETSDSKTESENSENNTESENSENNTESEDDTDGEMDSN